MAENPLTDLQVDVLPVFFSLPSLTPLLAGDAGLVAVGLSQRRTEDLDPLTSRVSVELAADALEAALPSLRSARRADDHRVRTDVSRGRARGAQVARAVRTSCTA